MNEKEKIKKYLEYISLSKNQFYAITGFSMGFLDKGKSIGADKVKIIINAFPELSINWLILDEGEMIKNDGNLKGNLIGNLIKKEPQKNAHLTKKTAKYPEQTNEPLAVAEDEAIMYNGKGVPLIPIEAMAGWGNGDTTVMDYDAERYNIPEFNELKVDFMIRVKGSSMYPNYNSGDIVACKKLPLDTFFQWNKVYVLDTIQGAMIKRLKKSTQKSHINCISDNKDYDSFDLALTEVHSLALVVGVIRLE